MSDTPRTDAAYEILLKPAGGNEKIVSIDFARTLERELAASEAKLKEMTEVAREFKYCIETEFDAYSIPCRGMIARLENAESTIEPVKRDVYSIQGNEKGYEVLSVNQ